MDVARWKSPEDEEEDGEENAEMGWGPVRGLGKLEREVMVMGWEDGLDEGVEVVVFGSPQGRGCRFSSGGGMADGIFWGWL